MKWREFQWWVELQIEHILPWIWQFPRMYCSINVLILAHNDESIHEVVARDEKKTLHQKKKCTNNKHIKWIFEIRNYIKKWNKNQTKVRHNNEEWWNAACYSVRLLGPILLKLYGERAARQQGGEEWMGKINRSRRKVMLRRNNTKTLAEKRNGALGAIHSIGLTWLGLGRVNPK